MREAEVEAGKGSLGIAFDLGLALAFGLGLDLLMMSFVGVLEVGGFESGGTIDVLRTVPDCCC